MELQGRSLFATATILSCTSFLLIGYDNGVLGGVIGQPAFLATFDSPDATTLGVIVSLYEVGCFIGAMLCSVFGERLGRRRSITLGGVIMLIGAILQATAYSTGHMIAARVVSGIGMGFINSTAPVYQTELAPKTSRGMWVCAMLSTLNFGIFLAYWVAYGFSGIYASYAWRVPVILQSIFIIPVIVLPMILPESPRWLVAHGRDDQALAVLQALRFSNDQESPTDTLANIRRAHMAEKALQSGIFKTLFVEDDLKSRRRLLIACGIQFFQQLGGVNGIIYYAGTIFTSIGFDSHTSSLMSGFLFTWFFVASFITWFLIDRIGRRPLFLIFISLMAAIFAVMAGLAKQIDDATSIAHAAGIGAAAMLFMYMGCFTIGFQATVWVYPPEILPLKIRQTGTSLATAANWITNYMIVQITPIAIENIGYQLYIIFAVFNACFVPIIYLFFPETRRMALEEVDQLFATANGRAVLNVNDPTKADNFYIEKNEGTEITEV